MNLKNTLNYLIQSGIVVVIVCCLLFVVIIYRSCSWDLLHKDNCSSVLENEICKLIRYNH